MFDDTIQPDATGHSAMHQNESETATLSLTGDHRAQTWDSVTQTIDPSLLTLHSQPQPLFSPTHAPLPLHQSKQQPFEGDLFSSPPEIFDAALERLIDAQLDDWLRSVTSTSLPTTPNPPFQQENDSTPSLSHSSPSYYHTSPESEASSARASSDLDMSTPYFDMSTPNLDVSTPDLDMSPPDLGKSAGDTASENTTPGSSSEDATPTSSTSIPATPATPGTPPQTLQCPTCPKTLKSPASLRKHMRSHNKTIRCPHCPDLRVASDRDLLRHHETHHARTRTVLVCPAQGCERRFTRLDNVMRHVRTKHSGTAAAVVA